jgi:hypothetical protein
VVVAVVVDLLDEAEVWHDEQAEDLEVVEV